MDTTATTHLSLCSGYGGIDLGLRRAIPDLRTIAYAEIEAFACENLLARMEGGQLDPAPIWPDLKSFPWGAFSGRVDILSGGYPCQPFSAAGKRLGTEDPRHLWPFIANGIRLLRPRMCFFENVEGHITLGLREVIGELESMGYSVSWGIFSAREVGAPHQRKRVFILAHRKCTGLERLREFSSSFCGTDKGLQFGDGSSREDLANRIDQGSQGWVRGREDSERKDQHGHTRCGSTGVHRWWPSRPGQPQYGWEPPRVVANSASQRTNNGQQLCGEECRQGGALPCESDESGEGVGNANSLDRRTPTGERVDDAETGSAGEAGISLANAGSVCGERPDTNGVCGREICESPRRSEIRSEDSGCGQSDGVMGNTDCGRQSSGIDTRSGNKTIDRGEGDIEQTNGSMGNAEEQRCWRLDDEQGKISGRETRGHLDRASNPEQQGQWQAQPSLGGDADGTASGMDYAELCVANHSDGEYNAEHGGELDNSSIGGCDGINGGSGRNVVEGTEAENIRSTIEDSSCSNGEAYQELCISYDNRTDELRLLGNGVVPATATLAFQTLLAELLNIQPNL